jgi:hypothetical protein
LARELADVIHYFFEDAPAAGPTGSLLPLAIPVGEKEAIRVAFLWNLAVELARGGTRPALVVPDAASARELVPPPAVGGVLAPQLVVSRARSLAELATDAASAGSRPGLLRIVVVPAEWIEPGQAAGGLLRWSLVFASPDPPELDAACDLAQRIVAVEPAAEVGVTFHGVESVAEARAAFGRLAGLFQARSGRPLRSYGLLLDDLLVYRGVMDRRPVVLSHPQSLAARALGDVGRLLLADARSEGEGSGAEG